MALAVLGALAAALSWRGGGQRGGGDAVAFGPSQGQLGLDLEVGRAYRYQLSYANRTSSALLGTPDSAVEGTTRLDAEVTLTVVRGRPDGWEVEWRLSKVRAAELRLGGRELLESTTVLDAPVGLELRRDGSIGALRFVPGTSVALANLVRVVLMDGQLRLAPADASGAWSVDERVPQGVAPSDYRARPRAGGVTVSKSRRPYLGLSGVRAAGATVPAHRVALHGRFELAARGHLTEVAVEEQLVVAPADVSAPLLDTEVALTLRLLGIDAAAAPDQGLWAAAPEAIDAWHGLGEAAAQAEDGRIGGLTWDELAAAITRFGASTGDDSARAEMMWRATALLARDPALVDRLLLHFDGAGLGARLYILDLLAATGHARAQEALRQLLQRPELQADPITHMQAIQRLTTLSAPDAATGRFALAAYDGADDAQVRLGAAYALGAVGGKLAAAGDPVGAEIARRLQDDLARAGSDQARVTALGALSNLGSPEQVAWVAPLARDGSSSVRAAVAGALSKLATPEARGLLRALAEDPTPSVQRAALRTLAEQRPGDAAEIEALCAAVLADRITPGSYFRLLGVLEAAPPPAPRWREVLEHMLMRAVADRDLGARIAEHLAQLPAA